MKQFINKEAFIALLGLLLMSVGAGFIYWPAGLITAGLIMLFDTMRKEEK